MFHYLLKSYACTRVFNACCGMFGGTPNWPHHMIVQVVNFRIPLGDAVVALVFTCI